MGMGVEQPRTRSYVRPHLRVKGFDLPPNNLLARYLDACESMHVQAQTGVAQQLLRRARQMQPLPYHKLLVCSSREEMLERLLQHMDPTGKGLVHEAAAQMCLGLMNPGMGWREALAACAPELGQRLEELAVGVESLRRTDLLRYLEYCHVATTPAVPVETLAAVLRHASAGLPDAEFQHSLLECLALPAPVDGSDPPALLGALFEQLDAGGEGFISVADVVLVAGRFVPQLEATQWGLELLARKGHEQVDLDEFLGLMLAVVIPTADLAPERVEATVYELLGHRIRPQHQYDFGRELLGPSGVRPVVAALRADPAPAGVAFRGCGLTDKSCAVLCSWLKYHPTVTSVDLSGNPIGDRGGVMLAQLLATNRRIVDMDVSGIHLLRGYSRDHTQALGPSPCEDAHLIMQRLAANQAAQKKRPEELVRLLRTHANDLKALFWALADKATGTMPLATLQEELRGIGVDWGFEQQAIDKVVLSDRFMGCGGTRRQLDDSGALHVSFAQLMHFLETEDELHRVMLAVRRHRLEVKRAFYSLLPPSKADAGGGVAGTSDDEASTLNTPHGQPQQQQQQGGSDQPPVASTSASATSSPAHGGTNTSSPNPHGIRSMSQVPSLTGLHYSPPSAMVGSTRSASQVHVPYHTSPHLSALGSGPGPASILGGSSGSGVPPGPGPGGVARQLLLPGTPQSGGVGPGAPAFPGPRKEVASGQELAIWSASWPTVLLSALRKSIEELALQPGSGWGVALSDLRSVFTAATLVRHGPPLLCTGVRFARSPAAAAAAKAKAAAAAEGQQAAGGQVQAEGAAAVAGGEDVAGVFGEDEDDLEISWPDFWHTCNVVLNR